MPRLRSVMLLQLAAMTLAPPAFAQSPSKQSVFEVAPLSDAGLAEIHGTGTGGLALRQAQLVNDQYSATLLQTLGQTSRVSLDIWFSHPGAALVANNLLAAELP